MGAGQRVRFDGRKAIDVSHRTWVTFAALVLSFAAAREAFAGPDGAPPVPTALTVGIVPGTAPSTGFSRDLFAELARDLGRAVVWMEVPRPSALRDLAAGRFAVAAGPFSADETFGLRALPPVALAGDVILKRAGDGALRDPADIAGKSVGMLGTADDVSRLRAAVGVLRARPPPRARIADVVSDVATGRLAAAAGPMDAVAAAFRGRPAVFETLGPPLGASTRLGAAMRADPASVAEADAVAGALARMRVDGRLAALQRQWFGLVLDAPDAARPPAPAGP